MATTTKNYLDWEGLSLYDSLIKQKLNKQVSDAIAAIVAEAPEAYDTLKEISDWISSHVDDAAAMNSQINTNKTDIADLKTLIGQLPEGTASTTIVAYISEVINASQADLTSAIATATSDISTLKSKVETLESVEYNAITEAQINSLFI